MSTPPHSDQPAHEPVPNGHSPAEPETATPQETTGPESLQSGRDGKPQPIPTQATPAMVPATTAASSGPPANRWSWAWIGAIVVLLVGSAIWLASDPGPEDVVEEFFEAVIDKDVDHALSLVTRMGFGVPYGTQAAFIHPDAVADGWEIVSVTEHSKPGEYSDWVDVELSDGTQTVEGRVEVEERDGDWMVVDPFVTVNIESSPFDYLQVNGMSLTLDELHAQNVGGLLRSQYKLLPGLYQFFGDAAGTVTAPEPAQFLFGREDSSLFGGEYELAVPPIEVTEEARQDAQEEFNALLDDCVTFEVRQPPNCPFGIDEFHDTGDDYVEKVGDITWSISEYPEVRLVDPGALEREVGMNVELDSTDVIELVATGEVGRDRADLSATCDVAAEMLRAALTVDGSVDVYFLDSFAMMGFTSLPDDTCEVAEVTLNGADDE